MKKIHGSYSTYMNQKCRCKRCRRANNEYVKRRRRERAAVLSPDDPRHGKYTTYGNHACRCQPCRDAWNVYYTGKRKEQRAKAAEAGQAAR